MLQIGTTANTLVAWEVIVTDFFLSGCSCGIHTRQLCGRQPTNMHAIWRNAQKMILSTS